MPIAPDTKDWTWVLDRPCPECGFDAKTLVVVDLPELIRSNADEWRSVLADPRAPERPGDDVWSALEYACHVRDVFRVYDGRLARMLAEDDPLYPNWDQDMTAVDGRYGEQVADEVADELHAAGATLADRFATVTVDAWARTGRRSDGAKFTIDSFGRYFFHDIVHHLHDVARGYEALGAAPRRSRRA